MLDLRRIRIGVEVSGQINYYEGLRVKVSGTKYANPLQNDCTVTITGLKQSTRDFILTETSPFNENRTPKRLIVEVGRVSTGMFRLFLGDIESSEPSSPPDIDLVIKAKTQLAAAGKLVSKSGAAQSSLSSLAKSVADDMSLTLDFQAKDRNVANYNHTGAALKQVEKLQAIGGVSAYIDDDKLVVKDVAAPLSGRTRVLTKDTGMVGIPKATEKGVKVTFLIDPETAIGGALRLGSKLNVALNGDYVINQLSFDVQSHEDPFFYTALATRL
ncbi:Phage protein [Pseudomonas chlororaphis subsp. aureofaciens]|uniref:baseplate hub protein n=1 Tax=Pseudomonas chlororaphis TaxID=587753 RepID=UPI000F56C01D|nr:hypothetical protein [Pseudomonas chlororaphis]AZD85015.1 Phage protein [Pseudomonas chlororaphis subsp. aureofaciens]